MEAKKSEKADLEWRKPVFFEVGLCVALALVLTAFNVIGPREKVEEVMQSGEIFIDDETIINTKREEPPAAPPEPIKNTAQIKAIENDIIIMEDIDINSEVGEDDIMPDHEAVVEDIPEEDAKEEEIVAFVEENAAFPGGDEALTKFLYDNLVYPRAAKDAGIQGKVVVEFVVEKDGRLTNVKVKRSVAPALDDEAIRVVKSMPKWKPGKQRNTTVRSRFTLPINFQLTN